MGLGKLAREARLRSRERRDPLGARRPISENPTMLSSSLS